MLFFKDEGRQSFYPLYGYSKGLLHASLPVTEKSIKEHYAGELYGPELCVALLPSIHTPVVGTQWFGHT